MLSLFCLSLRGRIRLAKSFTFLRKVAFFTVVDISITCMIPIVSNTTPHSVNCTSSGNNVKCLGSGTFCFFVFFGGGRGGNFKGRATELPPTLQRTS